MEMFRIFTCEYLRLNLERRSLGWVKINASSSTVEVLNALILVDFSVVIMASASRCLSQRGSDRWGETSHASPVIPTPYPPPAPTRASIDQRRSPFILSLLPIFRKNPVFLSIPPHSRNGWTMFSGEDGSRSWSSGGHRFPSLDRSRVQWVEHLQV